MTQQDGLSSKEPTPATSRRAHPKFADRAEAGRVLAKKVAAFLRGARDVLVLALPRGGVPVAFEVARELGAELDVLVVRKIGLPGQEEVAIGAIAADGVTILNEELIEALGLAPEVIERIIAAERRELERRERAYRDDRPPPRVSGRTVVVVDDGLATGATMLAAVLALRQQHPERIVVAVPVGALDTCQALSAVADEVICARTPEPFIAVGLWYADFTQTSDEEVRALLADARRDREQASSKGAAGEAAPPDPPLERELDPPAEREPPASLAILRAAARPITGGSSDYAELFELARDARLVLLGEGTHGTHEFYAERARITRELIEGQAFTDLAVEADWPDAYRVHRYLQGKGADRSARAALGDFRRFPTWMWRNEDVVELVEWLRAHNDSVADPARKVGFYGLDLYSLHASMRAVIDYLDRVSPEAATMARRRYACFDHFGLDPQSYALATALDVGASCEREAVRQLEDMRAKALEYVREGGMDARDDYFYAEQNARLVRNAEAYYRTMFRGRQSSWNLRDMHMAETLDVVMDYLGQRRGSPARMMVWEHNSHLGDARATEMGQRGELNVGQLVRETFGREALLVGFTTYQGTVAAASDWDEPVQKMRVRPAQPGTYEALLHETGIPRFLVVLRDGGDAAETLRGPRLERAIGVVYRPETERLSHLFHARLPEQFDLVVHLDATTAVEPLDRGAGWVTGDLEETFPTGL